MSPPADPIPPRHAPLPLRVQAGYASAELGLNTVETALRIYLLIYYTDVVGLQPSLAGLAVGIGLCWDAVTDPLMGAISDRTLHRFGGRRGYLPAGGLLLALGLLLVFWPPALASQAGKFAWLLGSFCLLNTGITVLGVPYTAMTGEVSADPHTRASLFGWRFAFANLGAILAAALPAVFLSGAQKSAEAMPAVSLCAAVLVLGSAWLAFRATARLPMVASPAVATGLAAAFVVPFQNAAFRPLLLAYVVATIGIGTNAAAALYYYQYRLRCTEAQIQLLLVVFLVVFTASILGWVRLARRCGKRRPLAVGATALGAGTAALYLWAAPGDFGWVLGLGGIGLASLVGCIVLIDTLLTDVIDHDRVRAGAARSGLYFGVWRFAAKLARAASIGAAGLVLDAAGFQPNQPPSPAVERALVLLFGPGVGLFFAAAGLLLWRYRFDERKQAQVRRILDRRAGRAAAGSAR